MIGHGEEIKVTVNSLLNGVLSTLGSNSPIGDFIERKILREELLKKRGKFNHLVVQQTEKSY